MADQTKTQAAWAEMVDALSQASDRFCGEEWGVSGEQDIADSHRLVLHILQSALFAHAEFDPERPAWRRIVSPTRKFTGDNADAVYFEAPVSGDLAYRVTGNLAGAVYTSFPVELGSSEGRYATAPPSVDGERGARAIGPVIRRRPFIGRVVAIEPRVDFQPHFLVQGQPVLAVKG